MHPAWIAYFVGCFATILMISYHEWKDARGKSHYEITPGGIGMFLFAVAISWLTIGLYLFTLFCMWIDNVKIDWDKPLFKIKL